MAANWNKLFSLALRQTTQLTKHIVKPYKVQRNINFGSLNGIPFQRCSIHTLSQRFDLAEEVARFSPEITVDEAVTPPSSWFVHPEFYTLEKEAVFKKSWIAVGRTDQVQQPGQYFAGCVVDEPFVVVRNGDHKLQAFYNVCRHHASRLVKCGEGNCEKFTCPYHGWTYQLNGRLAKATRLKGIKNFNAKNFGLIPIRVQTLGPLVFAYFGIDEPPDLSTQFQAAADRIDNAGFYRGLTFVKRVLFSINCNWKVFVDNYLDGGYHVPILHKDLTTNLDMKTYKIEVTDNYSIQTCNATGDDRLGSDACFVYLYPNFMINRYGPWMDTNLVLPVGHEKCEVVFDYYLEDEKLQSMTSEQREQYISSSLEDSKQVQDEDEWICENVQAGLKSTGYDVGRYAPHVELADHRFHQRLAKEFKNYLNI